MESTSSRTDLDITNIIYSIDVRSDDLPLGRMEIKGRLVLGSSDVCDFHVENKKVAPEHFVFKTSNDVLMLHNLGGNEGNKIGNNELQHGKMYILDKGDKLTFQDLEIIIRKDKIDELDFSGNTKSATASKKKTTKEAKKKEVKAPKEDQQVNTKNKMIKKSKGIVKKDNKTTNFILRGYAFITSMFLAYGLLITLFPIIGLDQILNSISEPLSLLLQSAIPNTEIIQMLLQIYIIHAIVDILSTLILKTSIPLLFLGISASGNKFQALIRSIIGIFTTPLLIFDLPVLFKKPSIKEYLSGSILHDHSHVIKLTGTFIILPLMICTGLLGPIALDLENINGFEISVSQNQIEMGRSETNTIQSPSQLFGATIKGGLPNDLELLPLFKGISANSPKQVAIYSHTINKYLTFEKIKEIDLKNMIKLARYGNPMFSLEYPATADAIQNNILQENEINEELLRLFSKAIMLSPNTFIEIITSNTLFISGLVKLRSTLLSELPPIVGYKFDLKKMGKTIFLIASPKETGENNLAYLLPLNISNVPLFKVSYPMRMKGSYDIFEQSILSKSDWIFEQGHFNQNSANLNTTVTAFTILDYFNNRSFDTSKFPSTYLKGLALKGIETKDNEYHALILESLKGIAEMIKRSSASSSDTNVKNIQTAMGTLINSVEKKDNSIINIKNEN